MEYLRRRQVCCNDTWLTVCLSSCHLCDMHHVQLPGIVQTSYVHSVLVLVHLVGNPAKAWKTSRERIFLPGEPEVLSPFAKKKKSRLTRKRAAPQNTSYHRQGRNASKGPHPPLCFPKTKRRDPFPILFPFFLPTSPLYPSWNRIGLGRLVAPVHLAPFAIHLRHTQRARALRGHHLAPSERQNRLFGIFAGIERIFSSPFARF